MIREQWKTKIKSAYRVCGLGLLFSHRSACYMPRLVAADGRMCMDEV